MDYSSDNERSRNIKADLVAELEQLDQEAAARAAGEYAVTRPIYKMLIAVLAIVGLFVASYLALYNTHIASGPIVCTVSGDCEDVNNSVYGSCFGIPVSVFGVGGYLAILLVALVGLRLGGSALVRVTNLQLAFATLGLFASAYFTAIEAFVLNKWCQWCVVSAITMTVIFALSIADRRSLERVVYEETD